jgi:hypothetical protein
MPEFQESNYEQIDKTARIIAIDRNLKNKFQTFDQERLHNFNMMVSKLQLTDEQRAKMEADGRPLNTYNLLSSIVKYISGVERGGRDKMHVVGRTPDDYPYVKMFNDVLEYCQYTANDFDTQVSKTALDMLIGRWGFIYQNWQYDEDPEGMLEIKRANPFIRFDTDVTELDFSDCDYMVDRRWLTIDDIIKLKALHKPALRDELKRRSDVYFSELKYARKKGYISDFISKLTGRASSYFRDIFASDDYRALEEDYIFFNEGTGLFMLIEVHETRLREFMKLYDIMNNVTYDITDNVKRDDGRTGYDNNKLQAIRQKFASPLDIKITTGMSDEKYITTVFPEFNMILQDEPYAIQNKNFMFTPIFAYNFHADIMQTQSPIDELLDPQKGYNKMRSVLLEIIMRTASVGWIVDEKAIEGYEGEWANREIGGMKRAKHTMAGEQYIRPDRPPQIPQGIFESLQMDLQGIVSGIISGIPQANMGRLESKSMPASLFAQQTEQGHTMLQMLFDNIDKAKHIITRNSVDNIQAFLKEERWIRITQDSGEMGYFQVNQRTIEGIKNDLSIGKYDIETSRTPYGRTKKETEFLKLLDIYKFISQISPEYLVPLLPVLIKASDTPYRQEILPIIERIVGLSQQDVEAGATMKSMEQERARLTNEQLNLRNQGTAMQNQDNEFNNLLAEVGASY